MKNQIANKATIEASIKACKNRIMYGDKVSRDFDIEEKLVKMLEKHYS